MPAGFRLNGAAAAQCSTIDLLLDGYMGFGFELKVALARIITVVVLQCTFDVVSMGIVPLDHVRVVAIHRSDEAGQRGEECRGQTPAETGGFLREVNRKIGERAAMAGCFSDEK
jgi:hypothetical protein